MSSEGATYINRTVPKGSREYCLQFVVMGLLGHFPHNNTTGSHSQLAAFSCTPRVQEVHTKAEVVHLTPGLLGLGVLYSSYALEMYFETYE